ncbi:MAG TPA: PIN domain-containing protein [Chloroflexota bacterium]|nr:PIN domain-containing protein [Chloroflexota bacterium]
MSPRRISSSAYPEAAFIDTSGFYALLDGGDARHSSAISIFADLSIAGTRLVFTNFVRAEAHALTLNRLGHAAANRLLSRLRTTSVTTLVRVTEADEDAALNLIARYRDKDFSLTDATSFVVMERLGIDHALSFDDDFRQYGWILLTTR